MQINRISKEYLVFILFPLALFYWGLIYWRNLFYHFGFFVTRSLPCPVISVGNISMGGTGKTPFVEYITKYLQSRGMRVGIVSRGYGRKTTGTVIVTDGKTKPKLWQDVGDEPFMLAHNLNNVPIVVDELRYRGGMVLVKKFKIDIIILDDGFQHRALYRNLDIVLINSKDTIQNQKLLPYGSLREPWYHLSRSDILVLTKINIHKPQGLLIRKMKETGLPIIKNTIKLDKTFRSITNDQIYLKNIKNCKIYIFSAIGDPEGFIASLNQTKMIICGEKIFPDHHNYNRLDIKKIEQMAKANGADYLITTEKDLIKLSGFKFNIPLYAVKIRLEFHPKSKLEHYLQPFL